MNQSLLTLGIVLSLGSVGCAGFGLQSSSSLSSAHRAERGVDGLWEAAPAAASSAEAPRYAEQGLGDLWESGADEPLGEVDAGYDAERGSDLWNPASVTRSWEPDEAQDGAAYRFSRSTGTLWY